MSLIRELYGLTPVAAYPLTGLSKIVTSSVVKSTEIIGIEVEVENVIVTGQPNRVWTVDQDGSLRNRGAEFITRPIMAAAAPVCLEYLMKQYLTNECCFSPRTSIHVHLNAQDITDTQVVDMVLLYAVYEKLFYEFAGKGRSKNIYCVPLADCDLLPKLVANTGHHTNWSKYTGLNLIPLTTQGTVEFRHMHGTSDVEKLSKWINLICSLKEYVKVTPTKTIRSTIAEMNDEFDFVKYLYEIFGDFAKEFKYTGPKDLNYLQAKQAMSDGDFRSFMLSAKKASAFFTFKE